MKSAVASSLSFPNTCPSFLSCPNSNKYHHVRLVASYSNRYQMPGWSNQLPAMDPGLSGCCSIKGLWRYFSEGGASKGEFSTRYHREMAHIGAYNICIACDTERKACLEEQVNLQQAIGLLRCCVDPAIRCDIPTSIEDPCEAWKLLEERHKPSEKHLRQLAEAKMVVIQFDQFRSVSAYLNQINMICYDIRAAGGSFGGARIAMKVASSLPAEYTRLLGSYLLDLAWGTLPNFKESTSRLLIAELEIKAEKQSLARLA